MPTYFGQEAWNFVRACEAIHELIALGTLSRDDRVVIEWSAIDLLNKLRPA